MSGLYLGACMPNLKFVSLVILELLAFNAQKIYVTQAKPLYEIFSGSYHDFSWEYAC